jgi:hypothetical protein
MANKIKIKIDKNTSVFNKNISKINKENNKL